jgi:hypothetical protein
MGSTALRKVELGTIKNRAGYTFPINTTRIVVVGVKNNLSGYLFDEGAGAGGETFISIFSVAAGT